MKLFRSVMWGGQSTLIQNPESLNSKPETSNPDPQNPMNLKPNFEGCWSRHQELECRLGTQSLSLRPIATHRGVACISYKNCISYISAFKVRELEQRLCHNDRQIKSSNFSFSDIDIISTGHNPHSPNLNLYINPRYQVPGLKPCKLFKIRSDPYHQQSLRIV